MSGRQVLIVWACALIAVAGAGLASYAAREPADGRVSLLVHLGDGDALAGAARTVDPGFVLVPTTSHYDGVYYYAIARDPFARGAEHSLIDLGAYRYGHAFYGQLAWVMSLGRPSGVPAALLIVSLLAFAAAAAAASLIALGLGRSPWWGLLVATSPGLLYAVTVDTAEPVAAALLGLAVLAWQRRCLGLAGLALTCLALTKEPLAVVPVGLLLYEAARLWRQHGRGLGALLRERRRRCAAVAVTAGVGPVALIGWLLYVDAQFHVWPLGQNPDLLHAPFTGIRDTLKQASRQVGAAFDTAQVGAVTVPLVIAVFIGLGVGIVAALRLRTVLDGVFLVTAPLMFLLGPLDLLYPKDLLRITVIPVLLLPAVVFGGRRVAAVSPAGAKPC